jgi:hypothetical protein
MPEVSKRLKQVAQGIMDSYYQDYAPDDAFFRIEDFAFWLGNAYGKYADEVAKEIYTKSLQEGGTGMIIFSQEWWARKDYDVEDKDGELTATVDYKTVAFTYDNQNSGIQELMPVGKEGNCGSYIRTSLTNLWILKGMGKNSVVYWYPDFNQENKPVVKFKIFSDCKPKRVSIYYIPSVEDENFKIPSNKAFEIATLAFNYMTAAKKESQFIDTTNDRNPNITPNTEVDLKAAKPVGT